jgi:hypothetical protein
MSLLWRFLNSQTRAERENEWLELRRREVEALEKMWRRPNKNCVMWTGGLCPNWGDDTQCSCRERALNQEEK